jgi:polyisoprenoid-binding protein YceI
MTLGRFLFTLTLFSLALPVWADDVFKLDGRNTEIGFVGTKKDGKHEGGFRALKGTITAKGNDPLSTQFKVDIDLKSMYTDNDKLTDHLKGPDFFNVNKFPVAKFVSTKVEKKGDKFEVVGKLTLKGVTKEVTIPASIEVSSPGITMDASFEINRHDWQISYGGKNIDDKVKMTLKVNAPR